MNFKPPRPFRVEKLIKPPETPVVHRLRELLKDPSRLIDLEIGCGVGWHPIRYALENPDRTLIAIEQTAEKFKKFEARILSHTRRAHPIENLLAVHADAVPWITSFVPDASVGRIYILYPNPNPKNAAARWIRMPFFGHLMKKLRVGGEICFRTNSAEYAEEIRTYSSENWRLCPVVDRSFSQGEVALGDSLTHFERKYLAAGEECTEMIFRP